MIRIRRPRVPPKVLLREGPVLRDACCRAVAAGQVDLKFERRVYAHKTVKESLRRAQHDKCAFCESKVSHVASGDVEHFRPKAAVRVSGGRLLRPGYYWLAYAWTNLLFACEQCNRRNKQSEFPLRRETERVRSPTGSVSSERPLFIDPAAADPGRDISFRQEYAHAVRRSDCGQVTLGTLGLNREPLVERRRDQLGMLRTLSKALALARRDGRTSLAREIEGYLSAQVEDGAEFAAMKRAALHLPAPRARLQR